MSRFLLDDETIERISKELPELEELGMAVMKLAPDFISMKFPPESNVPVAAVCFQDTLNSLLQVRIGLNECVQHKIWYQEKCNPPNEELAVIFMRFYIDGIVSVLYAAGEHLANGIICMLDLTDAQLNNYRGHRVSQQSILGHYLIKEQAKHPITQAVSVLAKSREWNLSLAYRSNLVHDQPPTVEGLGPVYRRRRRWTQSAGGNSYTLDLGLGDEAQYSIDEVFGIVQPAIFQFVDVFNQVFNLYLQILAEKGITLTQKGLQVKLFGEP